MTTGRCFVWPARESVNVGEDEAAPERNELGPGQNVDFSAGDGFGCHNGDFTWQAGDTGATILRAPVISLAPATPVASPPT